MGLKNTSQLAATPSRKRTNTSDFKKGPDLGRPWMAYPRPARPWYCHGAEGQGPARCPVFAQGSKHLNFIFDFCS